MSRRVLEANLDHPRTRAGLVSHDSRPVYDLAAMSGSLSRGGESGKIKSTPRDAAFRENAGGFVRTNSNSGERCRERQEQSRENYCVATKQSGVDGGVGGTYSAT